MCTYYVCAKKTRSNIKLGTVVHFSSIAYYCAVALHSYHKDLAETSVALGARIIKFCSWGRAAA